MEDYKGQIGIDLGTTYSCVGYWKDDHVEIIPNENGSNTTPSWVSFDENEILVGEYAKKRASRNPKGTIFGVKRLMGKRFSDDDIQADLETYPFKIIPDKSDVPTIVVEYKKEERLLKPEQISALILEKMKNIAEAKLGKKVKKAVITVPAYFNDSQRTATKNAAAIAGLTCDKILNEPTAAAMCYGLDKKGDDTKILIFDLGGGTFDVSVLSLSSGIFEVLATSGDTHLGGEDFDNIIMSKVVEEFCQKYEFNYRDVISSLSESAGRKLKAEAEGAKKALSTALNANIEIDNFYGGKNLFLKLSKTKFELWCNNLFLKCLEPVKKALQDAKTEKGEITEVVLVGGSTRIPKIQEILSKFFGGITLNKSVNPDEAVAYGAAIQGAILSKDDSSGKTQELLLLDITPLSLGIASKGGVMSKIIERNTQVPVKESKVYTTVEDGQTSVKIEIYEGERQFAKDNHKIGDFELTGIPKQAKGAAKIEVIFNIDGNGILSVKAIDLTSAIFNEVRITDTTRLSPDDVSRMINEADQFRADDELRKESLLLKYAFEKELAFVQQSVNDSDLITDEKGQDIITQEESIWINEFILNNLTWLEDNADLLTKDKVEQASRQFTVATKDIMSKIYSRKKQLDLKKDREQKDQQEAQAEQDEVQMAMDKAFVTL
jgi:L1 cell adhesion molecule like protein